MIIILPGVAMLAIAGGFSLGTELEGLGRELAAVVGFTTLAASTSLLPLPVLAYLVIGSTCGGRRRGTSMDR